MPEDSIRSIAETRAEATRILRSVSSGVAVEPGVLGDGGELELLAVDEALRKLAELSERQAKIVELRFFGGLSNERTAEVLDVSLTTVEREWRVARAGLSAELRA